MTDAQHQMSRSTAIAVSETPRAVTVADREQAAGALAHVLGTGDLYRLTNELQPRLQGAPQQVDDLPVQAPGFALSAFLEGCVEVEWQANEHPNQLGHDRRLLKPYCYNSSTMVSECSHVGDVVVGEIRRCVDVGMKGGGRRVIGVSCVDCGATRWRLLSRGGRPLPVRCSSCQGKRAVRQALVSNLGRKRPDTSERMRGPGGPSWRGGRMRRPGGYIAVWIADDDPFRAMGYKRPFVLEHRIVMARALGRLLESWEQVHHLNGVRDDNRIENLELWKRQQPPGIRQADYHCPGCRCGGRDDD